MLKTIKNKYCAGENGLGRRQFLLWAMLLAMLLGGGQSLLAQTYFTLTNGHYYWFDGGAGDTLANGRANPSLQYLTGFDMSNSWAPIHRLGTHSTANSTEIVEQGDHYLALDLSDPDNPGIQHPSTNGGFTPYCVWLRTGKTGHYYQEWDGYRYYLYASHSTGLSIYKVAVGEQMRKSVTWYDWDHGLAIEEAVWRDGALKNSDFWLIFDTLDEANDGVALDQPVWRMSEVNSYQRPEEMIYRNYRATGVNNNTWDTMYYYDNVRVGGMKNYPAGVTATFMPVTVVEHPKTKGEATGLYGMEYAPSQDLEGFTMTYGDAPIQVSPVVVNGITMDVTQAYTEYTEEVYRYGINLSSGLRTEDGFNQAGIPITHKWYYYPDVTVPLGHGPITRYDVPPTSSQEWTSPATTTYSLDSRGARFLTITPNNGNECTLSLVNRPYKPFDAYLTCTVTYDNGVTESVTDTLHITFDPTATVAHATNAPVIKGNLHGGGKMANVSGNTSVIVHNTDSIYAVYGGNDIAGWVQGDHGATLQVGTRYTDEKHPVHIGWVYGGGCGYYRYGGVYSYENGTGSWGDTATIVRGVNDHQYVFHGGVYDWNDPTKVVMDTGTFAYEPLINDGTENGDNYPEGKKLGGTIPYVKTARVTIGVREENGHSDAGGHNAHEHNDYILIDSLFGGGENAFVGVTAAEGDELATAVDLNVNGGTILAAFGGNNYGGAVAPTSLVNVNINCTKLTDDPNSVNNSFYHGAGRDFGIRHVYGGGNMVESTHASVTFNGGMVDTAYIGGNAASVKNPIGTMECRTDGTLYDVHGYATTDPGKALMNGHFIYTNPTLDTNHMAAVQPDYVPDTGLYNVHFLFGGNNKADMANVSFVRLHTGGVGAVLGGGNEGDMTNDKDIYTAMLDHRGYLDISPLLSTLNSVLSRSVLITPPTKIGAVIAADQNSKIIADYVHGGCRKANVKNSCGVYLAGGSYYDVFAGNDVSGDVGSETDGATYTVVTGDAVVHHNVYGGCDGYYHCDDGTGHYMDNKMSMDQFNADFDYDPYRKMVGLLLPTLKHSNVFVNGGLVKGNVVAGGVMASVGYKYDTVPHISCKDCDVAEDATVVITPTGKERDMKGNLNKNGTVRLEISDTAKIYGNVFGGGAFASVYGLSQIFVHSTPVILGSLFAGNDAMGCVESFLPYQGVVDYTGCTTTRDSLRAESLNRASQFSSNGDSLNFYTTTVDGIKQYNPRYTTYVLIEDSAVINSVYGSGNGAWDYDGTRPQFPSTYVCPGEEGNVPDQASAFIDIHTKGGFIDTVFGGGNGCTVEENVVVLLNNTETANPAYPDSIGSGILSGFAGGTKSSTSASNPNFVGTIFGGNNFSDMNTVPEIRLVKGNVKNVYGGGNAGNMTKYIDMQDICRNTVKYVSTHVLAESDEITVTDSVFGGCRMSDIEGMAYVEVRKTTTDGIQYLFGGNDVSGNVKGNSRIDMSGGTVNRIWGGSNGRYDYLPVDYGLYDVYEFGTIKKHPTWFDGTTVLSHADSVTKKAARITTAGRPDVDSTHVNLWGGNINASVFAGGAMADCRATCLIVDDHIEGKESCPVSDFSSNITVNGALYGGGEGRWDDLNARDNFGNRWGNVNGSTHVHLYHADDVSSATAYGGGGGGDVHDTYIKTYESWENPFYAVFGGNWGSEVYSTAHLEFNGTDLTRYLFGGNDFTGNVYRSEIVVNSGRFFNIFGGGNGDYPDSYYTSQFNYDEMMCPTCLYGYMGASPNAYKDNKRIEHPNTEYVHIVFNDGEVDSCLYGGGKMGTVLPYKKDPTTREYIYNPVDTNSDGTNDLNRFIPDTMRVAVSSQIDATHTELTFADPEDFSYTVLNIHGGTFHRNIFAGGRGYKANKKPLVYGVKVLNMDDGEVYESVYGGSEFVNDGYPAECKAPSGNNPTRSQRLAVTTMRPSSIVNITGGTVGSNLYGTGYQGIVYGSSYVNIGLDAIDSCTVWSNTYGAGAADSTYKLFKPGYAGGQSDALTTNTVTMKGSIYTGANWGNASGAVTFDNPGFVGGESRLYVDGKGYNTTNDHVTTDPEMNLLRSLYGSGTSVLGGDIHSHIEVRNYGGMLSCHPTRTFETIQRTDSLWLHNTAITFLGATDANQQYMSNRYSLKNIDYWNYRGYNVSELEAAVSDVANLGFFEQGSRATYHRGEKFDTIEVEVQDINVDINRAACGDNVEICQKEYMVSPTNENLRHTLLILDNGIDLKIAKGSDYGSVTGFGFVTTPGGYQSTITARPKIEITNPDNFNAHDGGFVTTCDTCNRTRTPATTIAQVNTSWTSESAAFATTDELKYTNHASTIVNGYTGTTKYREWKVGDKKGLRETEATLLAHTNPAALPNDDKSLIITAGTTSGHYGIAEAVFEMPATTAGHYYQLMDEGFILTGSNGNFELVDSAWYPLMTAGGGQPQNVDMTNALKNIGNWYSSGHRNPDIYGRWGNIPNGNAAEMDGTVNIHNKPEYTFGLIMIPDNNFATTVNNSPSPGEDGYKYDMPASIDHDRDPSNSNVTPTQEWARFIINGNARVNSVNHYCSPKVYNDAQNPNLKPSMRLYLTYDTSFSNTFNGNVKFKMMEYDENGNEVAPIQVTVYIQTIIDKLKDREQDVLAMYNGGRTNTFTRKLELVPTGEERDLYITGIRWMPTDHDGGDTTKAATSSNFGQTDRFSLLGDSSLVWATSNDYPAVPASDHESNHNHNSHNRFALTIIPTNNVSEDAIMANGWIRGVGNRTNVYNLANPNGDGSTSTPVKTVQWDGTGDSVAVVPLNSNSSRGYFVGTLDGRGSAMLDLELTFDGTRVYDKIAGKGYVGKVILTMETFSDEDNVSRGKFDVTIYVKTREHGDTIYIASANSVTRQVAPNKSVTVYPYSSLSNPHVIAGEDISGDIGKRPSLYVQSFGKALDDGIYEEGDVLCIMDTVKINNDPVHITGPNGPPIEVIRYDGHHHDLPDEQSVYRGPMVVVSNGSSFTAQNIAFHGGAGADIKHIKRSGGTDDATLDGSGNLQFWDYTFSGKTVDKLPDTNIAYAPIIIVTGEGSTVTLREGTIVEHNWNGYGSQSGQTDAITHMPTLARNMGAISVTNTAKLILNGDVTVENNYCHTQRYFDDVTSPDVVSVTQAPGGAAIYVDGGTMELTTSNRSTAVTITNNYLMNPEIHDPDASFMWWDTIYVNNVPEHYHLKTEVIDTWHPANVLLTRTAPTTGTDYYKTMNDVQSDVIVVSGTVGDNTKIGVRKWFPGEQDRDTIRFAIVTGGNNTVLNYAVNQNQNFQSDDNLRTFYNSAVNLTTAYLFRCASFKHQWLAANHLYVDPVYYYSENMTLSSGDVLQFNEKKNYCPDGGDQIVYRVQGGLMPYTFTWSDPNKDVTIQKTVTPYTNAQVRYDLENSDNHIVPNTDYETRYAKYAASMADTLILPKEEMAIGLKHTWNHLHVTATDATGECKLYKDIDLRIVMDHNIADPVAYKDYAAATVTTDTAWNDANPNGSWSATPSNGWTDTNRDIKAIVSRNFKGVHVTPRVWVDRTVGTISATIAGDANDYIYRWTLDDGGDTIHELTGMNLCPGDTIYLYTEPRSQSSKFIMWDFDPYYRPLARYIVPAHDTKVTAYYGPASGDYWYQHINTTAKAGAVYDNSFTYTTRPTVDGYNSTDSSHKAGFVNTYNGDIHIYDENGLAWLISRVNGLNGQQSRTFRFNRVLIHKKADGTAYDMKNHLWTPVGAEQHPFMGRMFGVDTNATADLPWSGIDSTMNEGVMTYDTHWYEPVVIKNIIVNEPQMYSTGLFGHMDSAGVYNIALHGELIRGSQYVGGIAGTSAHSYVRRSQVKSDIEDSDLDTGFAKNDVPTTILTTHYVSGGMLGKSTLDTVRASEVAAKFVGDAVYSGGGIGYGTGSIIRDVKGWNFNRLQGLYLGGMAGYLDGVAPVTPTGIGRLFGRKSPGVPSRVENNYFHIASDGGCQRLGGIVGYAENTIIENNYVYGELNASHVGGVVAVAGDGTETDHNYYQKGSASSDTYRTQAGATMGQSATFEGEGNDVEISSAAYGTTNLTHALNKWVREHNANGDNYLTWRSANNGENSGYPVFGLPGVIHVTGRDTVEGCGEVFYNGITYFQSTTLSFDVENYDESVDSSVTVQIIVHNEARTTLRDSADVNEGYQGYGFNVTPTEAALLLATIQAEGSARLVLTDTLQTQYGCDSIVTLLLIFTGTTQDIEEIELAPVDLKVYPNPTQNDVTVETPGMSRVELYDNEGRRLEDYTVDGDIFRISLVHLPSGMYYLRVHTPRGVTIQKIVKR